jgi:endonuclease/exonuclease/phosphatase family metal-dependent hydrolase
VQHKAAAPRDPTIPLVLGLAVVIAVVLLIYGSSNDDDRTPVAAVPSTTPSSPAPDSSPTPSESPKLPLLNGGQQVQDVVPAPTIEKLYCVQLPGDTEITAVSYNIKSLARTSAGAVAGVLRASGADVILIQEIKNARVGNQPAALAGLLGMHHAFAQNVAYGSNAGYGTAVLSRFPILSAENTHLPRPGNTQQRGLAHVVIDVDGKEVSIYNTHLQNLSESARMMQIRRIAQIVALDNRPQIFGGDMNAHDGSPVMGVARTVFTDTWGTVGVGDGRTHPSTNLRGRIDYLMHANEGIAAVTSDVLPARLSDHRAVRARYIVEGPGGQKCTTIPPNSRRQSDNDDRE